MMDWDSHINVEYSGSGHCVEYLYKYLFKGRAQKERIEMYSEQEHDSHDEVKLFIHGQVVCAMGAMWRFYRYQDYPSSILAVSSFKVQTPEQLNFIVRSDKISDLQVYYNRPTKLENFKYVDFLKTYNISSTLPRLYQNNTNNCRNNVQNDRHYFEVYINDNGDVYAYIYIPINKVKRCVRLEMLYRTSGDIYYMLLLLLHKPSHGDKDNLTYITVRGDGDPLVCASYQQLAIAHGIVDSIDDVRLTFNDMCEFGRAVQCRSYFVVLPLHGYETHAIFDNDQQRSFMYMDYIQFHNAQTIENAQVLMLQDLE
jgi:hypothetical protein